MQPFEVFFVKIFRKTFYFQKKNNSFASELSKVSQKNVSLALFIYKQNYTIMKKTFKLTALLLATTIMYSSCIGSFQLTKKVFDINKSIGSKWVNELIFAACCVLPVYEITLFADAIILNSIEFWTGKKLLSNNGEKKIVKNSKGENIEITEMENGYNLSNGAENMNLVFDEETQVWSAEYNNVSTNLIKIVDENNAQLFLMNGEMMDVTLDAEGMNMARMYMNNFAMNK